MADEPVTTVCHSLFGRGAQWARIIQATFRCFTADNRLESFGALSSLYAWRYEEPCAFDGTPDEAKQALEGNTIAAVHVNDGESGPCEMLIETTDGARIVIQRWGRSAAGISLTVVPRNATPDV